MNVRDSIEQRRINNGRNLYIQDWLKIFIIPTLKYFDYGYLK